MFLAEANCRTRHGPWVLYSRSLLVAGVLDENLRSSLGEGVAALAVFTTVIYNFGLLGSRNAKLRRCRTTGLAEMRHGHRFWSSGLMGLSPFGVYACNKKSIITLPQYNN